MITNRYAIYALFAFLVIMLSEEAAFSNESKTIFSAQSGRWSSKETWSSGSLPETGDRVVIRSGHHVIYDIGHQGRTPSFRLVQIAGELEFATDQNTLLEAGLITVTASEDPSEEGFDCHATPPPVGEGRRRPALYVGKPGAPLPAEYTAKIRLRYFEGMNKLSCPALVCCGGRMEIHGQPITRTWVKLKRSVNPAESTGRGATTLSLMENVEGWKEGDQVIVTSTHRQRDREDGDFLSSAQTEVRRVVRTGSQDFTGGYPLTLDKPLQYAHFADENFQAEVANLTRNVVIESAEPDGVRGHTMYHRHSAGSISYAEFRHLGKRDELGRYSIHFHLCGDTMRGSSVIGASIWDSHNRWITIHGTNALVIRDCVGYKSVGHGYFLEDGTEVNNILDHNLAALVLPAKTQKDQVVPFDLNRGAGFWWANCHNQFTRNVAAECAEYGYRFENKKTADFDPILSVRQPDGSVKSVDTRILPFIRFEGNEAHTMRFFCLNLRGIARPEGGRLNFVEQNQTLAREAAEALPPNGTPFWIKDFKAWEANWSVHLGTTGVFIDGLDSYRCDVAIWRSVMDRSGFRRMTSREMRVNDIHGPISMGAVPTSTASENDEGYAYVDRLQPASVSSFKDQLPPVTVITSIVRQGQLLKVCGSVADTSDIRHVLVNGQKARSLRGSFAEWEIVLEAPASGPMELTAISEDINGHVEQTPHIVRLD